MIPGVHDDHHSSDHHALDPDEQPIHTVIPVYKDLPCNKTFPISIQVLLYF